MWPCSSASLTRNSAMFTVYPQTLIASLTLDLAISYRSATGTGTQVTGGLPRCLWPEFALDRFHAGRRRELKQPVTDLKVLFRTHKAKLGGGSVHLCQYDACQLAGRRHFQQIRSH